jgi:hypothetical protein
MCPQERDGEGSASSVDPYDRSGSVQMGCVQASGLGFPAQVQKRRRVLTRIRQEFLALWPVHLGIQCARVCDGRRGGSWGGGCRASKAASFEGLCS